MSESWQKRLLIAAAAWNILGGIGALLDPAAHFAQMYRGSLDLSDPVQAAFFRTVWIAVIAWGFAYLAAAFRPEARWPVLLAGGTGKLAHAAACAAAYEQGGATAALLAVGYADLVFAALFFMIAAGEVAPSRVEVQQA
jgi:hypothetical protein